MSFQIPYESATWKPDNDLIPGNAQADNPVIFELVPAGGPDLARLKSVMYASAGLVNSTNWSGEMQSSVIAAFETGRGVFERCILSIRGLTIPAALAVRVGILDKIPVRADESGNVKPDPKAPVPVVNGQEFAQVVDFMTVLALGAAFEIAKISRQVETLDSRLFVQPSGSPSAETPSGPTGTVPAVKKRHGRRGTAD